MAKPKPPIKQAQEAARAPQPASPSVPPQADAAAPPEPSPPMDLTDIYHPTINSIVAAMHPEEITPIATLIKKIGAIKLADDMHPRVIKYRDEVLAYLGQ